MQSEAIYSSFSSVLAFTWLLFDVLDNYQESYAPHSKALLALSKIFSKTSQQNTIQHAAWWI